MYMYTYMYTYLNTHTHIYIDIHTHKHIFRDLKIFESLCGISKYVGVFGKRAPSKRPIFGKNRPTLQKRPIYLGHERNTHIY